MKSDLYAPLGVVATIVITILIMVGVFYYGTRPFQPTLEQRRGFGAGWEAKEGDANSGAALFAANCASCHQTDGHGTPGLAPSIRNRDFLALASDGFIRSTIKQGRAGTAMVPRPDLDDQQIADIVTHLRDVPVANPVDIVVDPDLEIGGDAVSGIYLFGTYCSSCHGRYGEGYSAGGSGPGIGLPGFLDVASDDYILKTLQYGRVGTPMMPFMGAKGLANLSHAEVGDIIAFLRYRSRVAESEDTVDEGPPDPGKGLALFSANCVPCHQRDGAGKPGLAPSIGNRDFLALASDLFIRQTVAQGRSGTAMIARPDLSSAQIDHIIAYLRSLPVANPFEVTLDPDRVAVGDGVAGKEKFDLFCASCHGPNGEGYSAGGSGPGIGLASFLNVANDDYILQTVKQGRVGTPMMSFIGARGLANLEDPSIDLVDTDSAHRHRARLRRAGGRPDDVPALFRSQNRRAQPGSADRNHDHLLRFQRVVDSAAHGNALGNVG